MSTLVSILLPTYNRGFVLGQCIDTVIKQTYVDWELIIADDGSKDDTPEVGDRYAKLDPRIKYHRAPKNQGLTRNRNWAISLSTGPLILMIEDDIIMYPDCLEKLVEAYTTLKHSGVKVGAVTPRLITERPEIDDLVHGRLSFAKGVYFYEGYRRRKQMVRDGLPSALNRFTGITYDNFDIDSGNVRETVKIHACSLFPRSIYGEVGGYGSIYEGGKASLEETDMCFRISNHGYKLYFHPKAAEIHKRETKGGCGEGLSVNGHLYFMRNHAIFLWRNFGFRVLYMYPFFFGFIGTGIIRYTFARKKLAAANVVPASNG